MARRTQFMPSRISLYAHWEMCESIRKANKTYTDSYVHDEKMTLFDQNMTSLSTMKVDFVWTAMMYALYEGYISYKKHASGNANMGVEAAIDDLRKDLDKMRSFRNAIFHVPTDPLSEDIRSVDKLMIAKIKALNEAFRAMFDIEEKVGERLSAQADQTPGRLVIRRMLGRAFQDALKRSGFQTPPPSERTERLRDSFQKKISKLDNDQGSKG